MEYYSEEWEEEYQEEDINKIEEKFEEDKLYENNILVAELLFQKLKFYCEFHGLDFFTSPSDVCISELALLLTST